METAGYTGPNPLIEAAVRCIERGQFETAEVLLRMEQFIRAELVKW